MKQTLRMDVLRCKTPELAKAEPSYWHHQAQLFTSRGLAGLPVLPLAAAADTENENHPLDSSRLCE
jgi:hypothetical protein